MLSAGELKQFALEHARVDAVGVANIERFRDAPPDMNPLSIMPGARSLIVLLNRILRGSYRGIDEGTHWSSYTVFCYAGLNQILARAGYRVARFLESRGHEAVHVGAIATTRESGPAGPRAAPGRPRPEVTLHHRIAATLAGLGEIGWSKVFLTEQFGPRQRLRVLLTDAELEPDPIRTGRLCDGCRRCVAECPAGAIPADKSVAIEVEGHRLEWADIDIGKCKLTHFGLNRVTSPFLARRFPGLYLPVGRQEVTWREAWDLGRLVFPGVPLYDALAEHPIAVCGARGCIIGCMKHMEERGLIENRFRTRPVFSEGKPWRLPERPQPADHHGFVYEPEADRD